MIGPGGTARQAASRTECSFLSRSRTREGEERSLQDRRHERRLVEREVQSTLRVAAATILSGVFSRSARSTRTRPGGIPSCSAIRSGPSGAPLRGSSMTTKSRTRWCSSVMNPNRGRDPAGVRHHHSPPQLGWNRDHGTPESEQQPIAHRLDAFVDRRLRGQVSARLNSRPSRPTSAASWNHSKNRATVIDLGARQAVYRVVLTRSAACARQRRETPCSRPRAGRRR